jgi:predicted DNA-binding protein YlxM (UPF0122 family)
VGDSAPDWNATSQLKALQHLVATLPDPSAPVAERVPRVTQRTARQLKEPEVQELVAAYEAGATLRQLAERFRITKQTVSNRLKREGITPRWRKLTEADVDEAVRLYGQGLSLARVGDRLGVTDDAVRFQLIKRGVKMRDRHGRERS